MQKIQSSISKFNFKFICLLSTKKNFSVKIYMTFNLETLWFHFKEKTFSALKVELKCSKLKMSFSTRGQN